jgi:hypothetical protein
MITQCCACKKVRKGDRWTSAVESLPMDARVSHGYCPECAKKAIQAVEDHYASMATSGASA